MSVHGSSVCHASRANFISLPTWARQRVKSETFSDEWHVRVYSHAARSSSRSGLFEDDRLTTADSGQRSRRIGHLSRVFPPWDVLSSLNAWATLTLFPRVLIQNLNNNVSLARGHRPTLLTPPGTTRICFQGLNIVVQKEIVVLQVHESSPVCGNLPHSAESERFVSVPSDHLHHQAWPSLRSKAATDTMQAISMPRGDQRETTLVCITSPPTSCPSFLSGHSMNCLHITLSARSLERACLTR